MTYFVINWQYAEGIKAYVYKGTNRQPYTDDKTAAKRWKTRKAAERFLASKDPLWASRCVIEEIDPKA